jgi:uncharacterized protein YjbJ (UPF0337 family)
MLYSALVGHPASKRRNFKETSMGATTDKVKGMANELAGKAKQAAGKATDNDRLRAEGAGQELKGKTQQTVSSIVLL